MNNSLIEGPGDWQSYPFRADNIGLTSSQLRTKYLQESLQYQNFLSYRAQQQQILMENQLNNLQQQQNSLSSGGPNFNVNSIVQVVFSSNFTQASRLSNAIYPNFTASVDANNTVTSSFNGLDEYITPLPVYDGFTASIHLKFQDQVQVTGSVSITDITNNYEGNFSLPSRGAQPVFNFAERYGNNHWLRFDYHQISRPSGSNPNDQNIRASQIILGGDPSVITQFVPFGVQFESTSLTAAGNADGTYAASLNWFQGNSNYAPLSGKTPSNLSASIKLVNNKVVSVIPNNSGIEVSSYTEYTEGNFFFISQSLGGDPSGSFYGTCKFELSGSNTSANYLDPSLQPSSVNNPKNTWLPYTSGSQTVYSGIYGDTIYIENSNGNNGIGTINTASGSISNNNPAQNGISLAINDQTISGSVFHSFKAFGVNNTSSI